MEEMEEKLAAAARAFAESSVRARLGALEMLDSCFEQQACDEQEVAVRNEALATVACRHRQKRIGVWRFFATATPNHFTA